MENSGQGRLEEICRADDQSRSPLVHASLPPPDGPYVGTHIRVIVTLPFMLLSDGRDFLGRQRKRLRQKAAILTAAVAALLPCILERVAALANLNFALKAK